MEILNISVENTTVKNAVELFIDNYKDSIVQFINNIIKGQSGQVSDAAILKDDKTGEFQIFQTAPDKGWVLGEVDSTLVMIKYTELPVGNKYVIYDGDRLSLFVKEPENAPDLKVGNFQNLNHAVNELNSKDVEDAVTAATERRDAAKKVEEDIERKKKLKALSKNESTTSKQD